MKEQENDPSGKKVDGSASGLDWSLISKNAPSEDTTEDPINYGPEGEGQFTYRKYPPYDDAETPDFSEPIELLPKKVEVRNFQKKPSGFWKTFLNLFEISAEDFQKLIKNHPNFQSRNMFVVFLIGVFLTPVTLIGSLFGWIRSYMRFIYPMGAPPQMRNFTPIMRIAMIIGAIVAWAITGVSLYLILSLFVEAQQMRFMIVLYLIVNTLLSLIAFAFFKRWWRGMVWYLAEARKFGSARFATTDELQAVQPETGFYIGGGYRFNDKGHICTVAGTRGGKGVNLIVPNLLGLGGYNGSWVVIDPKGENAAITARYQRESGKKVVMLNPWQLLHERLGDEDYYNPLDILVDKTSLHLIDDVQMIAEMIVPINYEEKDPFFSDSARSIIAGLLLYLVIKEDKARRTLATLWNWTRLAGDDWQNFLVEMRDCQDELYGATIRNAGNEIVKHSESSETFGSIMSHVLNSTDFIKSPALQKSMQTGFDPYTLADGNTTVYIIIPADKLQSHYRWLRLTVTSLMRGVVRKPKERVAFMLDEFAALGYLPEIETALSTYAGFNITVWPILQSMIQLKKNYGQNWESFIANTAVRHYFSINDNFSAEYISKAIGSTSHFSTKKDDIETTARPLVTPDELRRHSGENIFAFIGSMHPTHFKKLPYYKMQELAGRFDKNPYIK